MKDDPTNYKYLWNQLRREMADMATRAASEIEALKAQNARDKCRAYDVLSTVVGLLPLPPQGYGEDLAWRLRNQADILRSPDTPEPDANAGMEA